MPVSRWGLACGALSRVIDRAFEAKLARRFAFASVRVCQCARAWLSSGERPRSRPWMIHQNLEHFMGSLVGHCRPCSSAVRAISIRCCCPGELGQLVIDHLPLASPLACQVILLLRLAA